MISQRTRYIKIHISTLAVSEFGAIGTKSRRFALFVPHRLLNRPATVPGIGLSGNCQLVGYPDRTRAVWTAGLRLIINLHISLAVVSVG